MAPRRLPSDAGIAIGPILFILGVLGVIATVMAAGGSGGFGSAGVADRVVADVGGQANLIRAKVNECYMQYIVNGVNNGSGACGNDPYPCSDQTNGSLAADMTCPNDPLTSGGAEQSLWTGPRLASLPPPTKGFNAWKYMNAGESGGRCIWTAPTNGKRNPGDIEGLKKVAAKFTSQELSYDPTSNSQKMVIFITRPTGTADTNCTVP